MPAIWCRSNTRWCAGYASTAPRSRPRTELIVHLAGVISDYGFKGPWQLAIIADNLGGATSYALATDSHHDEPLAVYRSATYENTATATLEEIKNSPESVVRALVAKLLRSLGSDGQWEWLFT